jgi:hypothetical protein
MSEQERTDDEKPKNTSITVNTGDYAVMGEGLIAHVQGPTRDGIRVSDSRGWTASGDIDSGAMSLASATGVPSENEDLTLETCRFLVRRLNRDGATWGEPVELDQRTGSGVDAEARDTRDPRRRLPMQVIRAEVDGEFWKRLRREARSDLPPGTAEETGRGIWPAIQRKRLHAHPDVVLVLNAIRTPWLALRPVVDAFRRLHGQDARGIGFSAVWIVGANETFTERLDKR